jgi:uncharacterized protein YbcI
MSGWRDREARKQLRARRINEWIGERAATVDAPTGALLRCECRDPACHEVLFATPGEYEAVRVHATRFIVAANHENPESERIVEEHARFAVVESVTGQGTSQARRAYPRWPRQASGPAEDDWEATIVRLPRTTYPEGARLRLQTGAQDMSTDSPITNAARIDQRHDGDGTGQATVAISNAIVHLLSQRAGRGPTQAKTTITPELAIVTLGDALTTAEKTLLRDGHAAHVLRGRTALHHGVRREAIAAVEEATGREVAAYLTDHHLEPNVAVVVFVFAPLNGAGSG